MSGTSKDTVREGTTIFVLIKKIWPHFMRQKALFFGTMAAVVFVATVSRLTVYLFGLAIDRGLLHKDRDFVVEIAIAYFCLEASRCFLTFLQTYLFEKLGNRVLFDIRDDLIRHVQRLPITYFEKNPIGRIVTRLTSDVVSLGDLFTQGLIAIFASLISLVAIIVAMLSISVNMTFLTLLIAPPIVCLAAILSRRILVVLRESKVKMAAINAYIAENISGMKLLQLYGRVGKNTERFRTLSADYRDQQLKSVRLYAMLWPAVSFFNAASVATGLYIGGQLTMSGAVTTGAMVAFILHVRAFMDPLNTILEKYQILQNSVSGAERIFTLQDEVPEESSSPAWNQVRLKGDVEFKDVEFKYAPHLKPALRNLNLTVRAGESVALIGRTGSGKSTLITLLQRFYDPTSGSIMIDGLSSLEIPRRELRSRIGVVQQDTFMFRGTIADNIGLRDPSISREAIVAASESACLAEMLSRRSEGLEAPVEERGANLSQGERQLIAFARILAFDPDILILDEATANIDSQTEQWIQEATRRVRKGRTSFIIAHRLSTVADCDQIVKLDGGVRVFESSIAATELEG